MRNRKNTFHIKTLQRLRTDPVGKMSGKTTSRPNSSAKKSSVGRQVPLKFPGVDRHPV